MSSKINLQTCEYARKSSIFQDNQLISYRKPPKALIFHGFFLRPEMISAILKQFEKRLNQLHAFLERQGFL